MVEPQLSKVLTTIEQHQANKVSSYGISVVHIKSIAIKESEATVNDCLDSSKAGMRDTTTRRKINRGIRRESITTTLKKGSDQRWRVSKYVVLGEGC
ncbi:hypothetical protein GCM10010191_89240 [Actinomadura vinacea]|uniref:Uncharacterized protein n=2 Tax=Actinomadura vinacea TaxID=115336 RepID=A0ABN3KGQ3_9ACTN